METFFMGYLHIFKRTKGNFFSVQGKVAKWRCFFTNNLLIVLWPNSNFWKISWNRKKGIFSNHKFHSDVWASSIYIYERPYLKKQNKFVILADFISFCIRMENESPTKLFFSKFELVLFVWVKDLRQPHASTRHTD